MASAEHFQWKGHTVHLYELIDAGGDPCWVAEVEGTDLIHVMWGDPGDDPERYRHRVRDWIDDGLPVTDGPGA